MRYLPLKAALAGAALIAPLALFTPTASAHPSGMCHVAGNSGVVVYFPPGAAANAHHRHMASGVHPDDYPASAADARDFADTGNRKCQASRVNPTG
jgi:hypothetical protein